MSVPPGPAGALLRVDKPEGPTSHDVVARVRRTLRMKRVGHTGTLDPFATGLMVLCLGPATRLAEFVSGRAKTYEAVLRLGIETDTLDPEGAVTEEDPAWTRVSVEAIEWAAASLRGTRMQRPPVFSAKKAGGERAYAKARRGEAVRLDPVEVEIRSLDVTGIDGPDVSFHVECSSGTYVRVLGRDLAHAAGTVGSLTALRRTAIGHLTVEGAVHADALEDAESIPESAWVDPVDALAPFARARVGPEQAARLRHGQALALADVVVDAEEADIGGPMVVTEDDRLVAVARAEAGALRPSKVFPA